jgi:hypothetical protein
MATHVKVLAGLFVVIAVLLAALAFFAPLILGLIGHAVAESNEPDAATVGAFLGLTGAVFSAVMVCLAAPFAICAYGLFKMRPWARIMAIILSAMCLINLPFGTLVGIYGLIVLFQKQTEQLFATAPRVPGV